MSDIRFNQWLHQSGTGGVSQVASGAVGVGTTNPLADFYVRGDAQITGILTAGHIAMGSSITFGDDDRAYFGNGTDLQIYHSGSDSFIQDTGTGDLKIRSSTVRIEDTSGNLIINATPTTAYLYSSGNAKLGTAGWGAQVTGIFKVLDATDSSGSTNKISIGTGNDFNLFHDSSHSYISNTTGHLTIQNNVAGHIINLQPKAGANGVITRYEGASELYYNGNKKFETTNTGAVITGILTATGMVKPADGILINGGNISLLDRTDGSNHNLYFGTGAKAAIYHDGSGFSIVNNTGHAYIGVGVASKDLHLYAQASGNVLLQQNTGVRYVKGVGSDASVQLFFNNNEKFKTTASGVEVTNGHLIQQYGGISSKVGYVSGGAEGYFGTTSNHALFIGTADSNRIKISNSSAATSIGGSMVFNAMLTVQGDVSGQILNLKAAENTTRLMVAGNNTNDVEVNLYDKNGGQRGILIGGETEFALKAPNSSAPMTFYTNNGSSIGERLRITSGGSVVIGTGSALSLLTLRSTASTEITLVGGNSNDSGIYFNDGANDGAVIYHHGDRELRFRSGAQNRMIITSDGSVNKPKNPAFYAWLSTNNPTYTAGTTVPWDNTDIDTRSAFETSGSDQGRFIVPTTGIYYFGWRLNRRDDSRFDIAIYKNGSIQYIDEMRWAGNSGMWMAESGHYLMSCTEGQKIDLRVYSVTATGTAMFDGGGNGYYDAFFGWMVG